MNIPITEESTVADDTEQGRGLGYLRDGCTRNVVHSVDRTIRVHCCSIP